MKKRILFSLIFIALLFLLAELFARAYYYRKPAKSISALYELMRTTKRALFNKSPKKGIDNSNHYLIRPGVSKEVNDSIAAENRIANYSIYQPWIEFRFGNIHGKYVNAFDQVRKSDPEISAPGGDPLIVWFLGGSTMFGHNLTDAETIPSAFVREYRQRGGRPIRVVNYGTPFYFSYHELIQLSDNLFRGKRPDVVIMLDGLNEGAAPFASYTRNPFHTPRMQELLNPELYSYPEKFDYYRFPDSTKIQEVSQGIFDNYFENIGNAKKLADQYQFKLYCFWQPVSYFDYPNRASDPICNKKTLKQFDYICPQVKKKAEEVDYLFYLGDMLREAKLPFIDGGHYAPWMCEAIAKRMLDSVGLK